MAAPTIVSGADSFQVFERAELGGASSDGESAVPVYSHYINISADARQPICARVLSVADPQLPCGAVAQAAMPPSARANPAPPGSSHTLSFPRGYDRTKRCLAVSNNPRGSTRYRAGTPDRATVAFL